MTKDEALDLALEALDGIHPGNMTPMAEEYWNKAITAIKQARALDKKAENAKELGLDYEPVAWMDSTENRADEAFRFAQTKDHTIPLYTTPPAAPVQEPVAAESKFDREKEWGRCSIEHHNLVQSEPHKWPGYQTRLLYTTPPAAQRQWVGLTTEEIYACDDASGLPQHEITNADLQAFAYAIEAKLKEKNT